MTFPTQMLWPLVKLTVTQPGTAAKVIRGARIPREIAWMALILAAVVTALMVGLVQMISPPEPVTLETGEVLEPLILSPLQLVSLSLFGAAGLTIALWMVGRKLGGAGDFDALLAGMAWLQIVMVVVQGAQVLGLLIVPFLGLVIALVGVVVFLRALGHFVRELHGFQSMGQAVGAIVLSFVALFAVIFLAVLLLLGGSAGAMS
ncbi:MAG: Yip1 domain protein [Rhodobacteraceae bacterium HLUCCA08]|nr:MAG: Yip1 domain protein [Rhodobacteraceae bacterium HLUCCA08]